MKNLPNLSFKLKQDRELTPAIEQGMEAVNTAFDKLYPDGNTQLVNIKEYLDQLVSNLLYSYGDPFKPNIEVSNVEMDIDLAIPISLIVNELVTNALKYAYEGVSEPEMLIALEQSNGHWLLKVADNGIGLAHRGGQGNSFGMKLVRLLVHQLGGTLEEVNVPSGGVTWQISIPVQQSEES